MEWVFQLKVRDGAACIAKLGRYLVAQVLKFIPGVGTVASGMINGTVATTITVHWD